MNQLASDVQNEHVTKAGQPVTYNTAGHPPRSDSPEYVKSRKAMHEPSAPKPTAAEAGAPQADAGGKTSTPRWILALAPALISLHLGCSGSPDGTGSASSGSGGSGTGGTGGSSSSSGGSGGTMSSSSSSGGMMDPCAGGTPDPLPSASSVSGHGFVELDTTPDNPILALTTTLVVPPKPPASGTLFLWPGLQPLPGGAHYLPIDNGVLQPVLTWGPTCAPHAPSSSPYADWWVSAQYVNTVGQANGFTGCQGGPGMTAPVGDTLTMTMTAKGTIWTQSVTSLTTGASVSFDFDLQGQSQNRALFLIEAYSSEPTGPVQFGETVVTFTSPAPSSCHVLQRGMTDVVSTPVASVDGTRCCIPSITLKMH